MFSNLYLFKSPGRPHVDMLFTFRLVYHDASVDPLGRDGSDSLSVNSHLSSYLTDSAACSAYHSVAIVIDCLSLSLLERSGPLTCQTLASLRELKLQGKYLLYYVDMEYTMDYMLDLMTFWLLLIYLTVKKLLKDH